MSVAGFPTRLPATCLSPEHSRVFGSPRTTLSDTIQPPAATGHGQRGRSGIEPERLSRSFKSHHHDALNPRRRRRQHFVRKRVANPHADGRNEKAPDEGCSVRRLLQSRASFLGFTEHGLSIHHFPAAGRVYFTAGPSQPKTPRRPVQPRLPYRAPQPTT